MTRIRILPPEVVRRIQAGEIVERPASVLKELVENAIDASATEVLVDIEDGGKKLIRVRDNGSGIVPEEMPLAFERHATSKLTDEHIAENLFGVATLGFRGEALASIAAVARVEMVARVHGAEHGHRYTPGDGEPRPAARPGTGTTIEVRDLFHSVPARRKFLRSAAAELSRALEEMSHLALGFPGLRFLLTSGGKPVLDLSPAAGLRERLGQLGGKAVGESLIAVEAAGRPSVAGFIGNPRAARRDARAQHFFVNGRWVRDRLLSHALRAAFQGYQIPGLQPIAYLFLELPSGDVDVNVHPMKTEVRFRDSSGVYGLILGAVRDALARSRAAAPSPQPAATVHASARFETRWPAAGSEVRAAVEAAARDFLASPPRERMFFAAPARAARGEAVSTGLPAEEEGAGRREEPEAPRAFQVLKSYIVVEAPDGIVLIDQHALHEKIIFEEVHRRLQSGAISSQRLVVPEVIDFPPEWMPFVEEAAGQLEPFGFEVAPFGPAAVAVHAFPSLLDRETGRTDLAAILRGIFAGLAEARERGASGTPAAAEAPGALREEVRRIAALMACKRAVKAGAPLNEGEIRDLLARGSLADDPRHCPHGRPTSAFVSRREIERRFDRK